MVNDLIPVALRPTSPSTRPRPSPPTSKRAGCRSVDEGKGPDRSPWRARGHARAVRVALGLGEGRPGLQDRPDAGRGPHRGTRPRRGPLAVGPATSDRGRAFRLRHRDGDVLRPPAQGEGRAWGRGLRRVGAWGAGLGRGMGRLAAAHRRPPGALDPEDAESSASRNRPRGVRRGLGTPLLGARRGRA